MVQSLAPYRKRTTQSSQGGAMRDIQTVRLTPNTSAEDRLPILVNAARLTFEALQLDLSALCSGGFFVVGHNDPQRCKPLTAVPIGVVRLPDIDRARGLAQEKLARLSAMAFHENHKSAWQSRNPDRHWFGGAVVAGQYILSFAGGTEIFNETFVLGAGLVSGLLMKAEVSGIARLTGNDRALVLIESRLAEFAI